MAKAYISLFGSGGDANPSDVTPPILTSQTVGNLTSSGGIPAVTTDEGNGTVYMVVVPNNDSPSVAQIKAGQQSSGAAALNAQNKVVSGAGVQTFSVFTGRDPNTAYDCWFVHTDAAGNNSTAVKVDFTTVAFAPTVLDTFTGVNGDDLPVYSANWSTPTGGTALEIQTNQATGTVAASANNFAIWNATNFGPDCEVAVQLNAYEGNGIGQGIMSRCQGEGDLTTIDGYFLIAVQQAGASDNIILFRLDNGASTQLGATIIGTLSNGLYMGLESVGSLHKIFASGDGITWSYVGERTEATYSAAGKAGLFSAGSVARLDNFSARTKP